MKLLIRKEEKDMQDWKKKKKVSAATIRAERLL